MAILNSVISLGGEDLQTYPVKVLAVGGGGGGGKSKSGYSYSGGGGGGGQVICTDYNITSAANIIIGCGGTAFADGNVGNGGDGGCTIIDGGDGLIAKGGQGGKSPRTGGCSGNGCIGGTSNCNFYAGGGGGAGGNGQNGVSARGGNGGIGLYGYGGGGGGASSASNCKGSGVDGGGNGCNGSCNATNYGGGGGGGTYQTTRAGYGCGGMVEICYKADGSCGFKIGCGGDCCYTCDGYCVHRFTSNGTFSVAALCDFEYIINTALEQGCSWGNARNILNTDSVGYYNKFNSEGRLSSGRARDIGATVPVIPGIVEPSDGPRDYCIGYYGCNWFFGRFA